VVSVSIVIAAHDEAPAIAAVVHGCRAAVPRAEIVVVDDGSTDDTGARATSAGARVVALPHNLGKGAALRRGAAESRGAVLVLLDGDGQDDPAEIPRLLHAIDAGADLVIGSRFLGTFHPGAIRAIDRLGNRLLTGVFNLMYGTALTDTQAGFRAIRRDIWDTLPLVARRYDVETDVLAAAIRRGARVHEVPVARHPRRHGGSGLHAVRDGTRILGRMMACRLRPP
jgi:glycosyltransferase involved in cell wall biosynthesis